MTALRPPARTYSVASSCQRALGAGRGEPAPGRAGALAGLAAGPRPLRRKDPRQGRGRGGLQPHRAHLVVHPDGAVAPAPRTPARFAPPEPAGPSPGRSGSGWMPGGSSAARRPPPVPRTWPGPASRRTSCARCPARRTRRSPRPWGRRRARARSPGGHGDQHEDCVHSPRNPSGGVTAPSPRTVTDVLIQNCHRCPETSQYLPAARSTGNLRVREKDSVQPARPRPTVRARPPWVRQALTGRNGRGRLKRLQRLEFRLIISVRAPQVYSSARRRLSPRRRQMWPD